MRRVVLASAFLFCLAFGAGRADAQTIGPVCFADDTFSGVLKLYFNPSAANQLVGTGVDTATGGSVSATAVLNGGVAIVGLTAHTPPPPNDGHSYSIGASISLASGSGPAHCEAFNTTSGCTTEGTSVNMFMVACPAGDVPALDATSSRPRRGGSTRQ